VLDRATVVPGSIRHYLAFSNPHARQQEIRTALEMAGLADHIDKMDQGLDTLISSDGFPLSLEQTLCLKLAAIYLSRPSVLVLKHISDLVEAPILENIVTGIQQQGGAVIYFTQREDFRCYTRDIDLDHDTHTTTGAQT
jgi:putative ABC transport system ATP-binding protein